MKDKSKREDEFGVCQKHQMCREFDAGRTPILDWLFPRVANRFFPSLYSYTVKAHSCEIGDAEQYAVLLAQEFGVQTEGEII